MRYWLSPCPRKIVLFVIGFAALRLIAKRRAMPAIESNALLASAAKQ